MAHNAKTEFGDQIDIFVSQKVESIELNETKTQTKGVLLSDGKFIESNYILSNCTAHVTFQNLLKNYKLEEHTSKEISVFAKRVNKINYESGTMKINLAVNKLPNFKADPSTNENTPMPHHQCTIHINCENMKQLDDAFNHLKLTNRPSDVPMIEMVIPSVLGFFTFFPFSMNKLSS